jgi:hypothetical protein
MSREIGFVGIQVTTLYKFDGIQEFVLLLLVCVVGPPIPNGRQGLKLCRMLRDGMHAVPSVVGRVSFCQLPKQTK